MKKILLTLVISVFTLQKNYAQGAEILWDLNLGSEISHFAKISNGGFALATVNLADGYHYGWGDWYREDYYSHSKLIFTDFQGKILKETYLGKEINEGIREVFKIIGEKDGYTIFGVDKNQYSDTENKDRSGVWIMNTDCYGKEISSKIIWPIVRDGESGVLKEEFTRIESVLPVEDGYLLHVNLHVNTYPFLKNSIIFKIDKAGQLMWEIDPNLKSVSSMKKTRNNEYIIIGSANNNFSTDSEIHYLKLNKDGNILIRKEISDLKENILSITNKNKKNLFSYQNENNKLVVVELDDEGKIIFETIYDKVSKQVNKFIETEDNCYLMMVASSPEMVLIKMNKKGDIIWQQEIDPVWEGSMYNISDLGNNEYLIYGHSYNKGYAMKLKDNSTNLGIDDQNIKNDPMYLYPNPVDTYLFIKTPNNQKVKKVLITDITGKLIMERRKFQDKIDVSMYEPGIYIIKIETDRDNYIQKVLKR